MQKRVSIIRLGRVAAILVMWMTGLVQAQPVTVRPSMVLFLSGDLNYFDIGCYGGQAETPNIDRLAAESIRFTSCYQAASVDAPSHQNLYTGLYPVKNGAYTESAFVKPDTKSIPHFMKALGYRVALIGVRHMNPLDAYPFEYLNEADQGLDAASIGRFVLDCGDQPYVLIVASPDPRYPWDKGDPGRFEAAKLRLPPNWVDTPETRHHYGRYLAEVNWMDAQVGAVVQQLKNLGKFDSTIFFYSSTQGSSFPFAKWTCYEAGLHAAMVVRWPSHIDPGTLSDGIIDYTDVLPTMIDLAGGEPPDVLDGRSFKGLLLGEAGGKDYTFAQQTTRGQSWASAYFGIRSIRDRRYTYIVNFTPDVLFDCRLTRFGDGFFGSWREAAWRDKDASRLLLGYISRPPVELYDRAKDPFEMDNLAGAPEYRHVQERLSAELGEWMNLCGDKGQETEMEALEHSWEHFRRVVEGHLD